MGARRLRWPSVALLIGITLVLSGCASSSIQTGAASFLEEHGSSAVEAAAAGRAVEAYLASLSGPLTRATREQLTRAAARARRDFLHASEWGVGKTAEGGEEAVEEEDLPRAETEATEGAHELAKAMSALQAYVREPRAERRARYRSTLSRGREQWNESLTQLWYLAHRSHPPLL